MSATKQMWASRLKFLGSFYLWGPVAVAGFIYLMFLLVSIGLGRQAELPLNYLVAEKYMSMNLCYRKLALESVKNEYLLTNKTHKDFTSKCGITNIDELNRQKDLLIKFE